MPEVDWSIFKGKMTVEHTIFQQQKNLAQNQEIAINQLKEVTGVKDEGTVKQAYEASGGDVNQAIAILTEADKVETPAANVATNTAFIGPRNINDKSTGVIDLTNEKENQNDLQRAIALSLQDSGTRPPTALQGMSTEDQDLSRALEESLAESVRTGSKRRRGDGSWFLDPLNPYDRRRENGWPVGLKNVGNTCWFSAVIQSLFHLPVFRRLVLGFVPPANATKMSAEHSAEQRNLAFMAELRALFALMIGTNRKYVDPTKSVQILKAAFNNDGDSQQDVSEFTHKLLEWLEETFKSDCSRPPTPKEGEESQWTNPMLHLFYGQFMSLGVNEGKVFKNKETFGQYPLHVKDFVELHDSIEASTAHGEIENVNSDTSAKSGQEHWFTRLPQVLTFELSRFHFNQQLGKAEKIHNRCNFARTLYMDRYMACNIEKTKKKREDVRKMKQQVAELQSHLERYMNYGSGAKRFPLQDVLQYALEFANSKPIPPWFNGDGDSPRKQGVRTTRHNSANQGTKRNCVDYPPDIEMAGNALDLEKISKEETVTTQPSFNQVESSLNNGGKNVSNCCPQDVEMLSPDTSRESTPTKPTGDNAIKMKQDTTLMEVEQPNTVSPVPKHVTEDELNTLQSCLCRWRREVMTDVEELQKCINTLKDDIESIYDDDDMKQYKYSLHAVLVHEGQASSGHYWAYVLNHARNVWLKFNDVSVTEVTWEELQQESVGGDSNTSAYCLIYVDDSKHELFEETNDEMNRGLNSLSEDLQELVLQDNKEFEREMESWDQKNLKNHKEASTETSEDDIVIKDKMQTGGDLTIPHPTPASPAPTFTTEHSKMQLSASKEVITRMTETFNKEGPQAALKQSCEDELIRLKKLASQPDDNIKDVRLESAVVYFLKNSAPDFVIQRALLEQFADKQLNFDNRSKAVRKLAQRSLDCQTLSKEEDEVYKKWHLDYKTFRKAVLYLMAGCQKYCKESYQEALPYFVYAFKTNDVFDGEFKMKRLDPSMLALFRRQCLLYINEQCSQMFESGEEVEAMNGLQVVIDLIVPGVVILNESQLPEDTHAEEDIRERWCNHLAQELSDRLREKLTDILGRLVDVLGANSTIKAPPLTENDANENLLEQFTNIQQQILAIKKDSDS
ncbi:ubiquitin carboxyl-terminal hydrolase 25-like isoform X2 [Anneissia japonica]|uniref:ubiquitin carboxyl-terminal hydrolase 25-like isoform X2 n=1 Tax=Anneissia japonica TaxID=1529436 RepID=UPI001425B2AE|nr:ubiquitin carboxyl-terminal hydrolase 25-like isoform X2 [Anneissia japonica]